VQEVLDSRAPQGEASPTRRWAQRIQAISDYTYAMTDDYLGDDPIITYTIAALGPESWFVESDKGTSGYSFRSLAEAERFAISLAQRNTPSRVCITGGDGEIITERVFEHTPDAAR
jgi:hypothetical protein